MVEDRLTQALRLKLMSNAMLIKSLCSQTAFDRMLEIRDRVFSGTEIKENDLAIGYKLVVQSGLWGLLDGIIYSPELLGLEPDYHLYRWWSIIQGDDGKTLKAAITDPDSELARVTSGIDDVITAYLRAGVSWEKLSDANKRAEQLADELLEIAHTCRVSGQVDSGQNQNPDRILLMGTVGLLQDSWFEDVGSPKFRYGRRKPTVWKHLELPGESMFDIQTHRDQMRMLPEYDHTEFKPNWLIGKLSAVTVSLQETGRWSDALKDPHKLLRQNSDPDSCWEAGKRIFRVTPSLDLEGLDYGLKRPPALPSRILPSLSAKVSLANPVDRLAALLGRRPKLIASRDSVSRKHIEIIVSGLALELPGKDPIEILRIVHGSEVNEPNEVSLALRMSSGTSSEWWVFDRPYRAEGLDPSNDQRVARINDLAKRLDRDIEWIDLVNVPEESLLSLCDSRSFRHLLEKFEEIEKVTKKIRGAIPELLSGLLLSQSGYHQVRVSLKVTFPPDIKREIDAIGIRFTTAGSECKIIEVKGKSDSARDLDQHIGKFYETMHFVDTNRSVIEEAFGTMEPIQSVSGLFISMGKNVELSKDARRPDMDFWGFDRFVEELLEAGFDELYVGLLQDSLIFWESDLRDFFNPRSGSGEFTWITEQY